VPHNIEYMTIARVLPKWIEQLLRELRSIYYSKVGRYCPVCEQSSRKFSRFGIVPRKNAECMWCGALERHRLIWLYFNKMTNLFDGRPKRVLHVAPEGCFERRLKKLIGDGYITADINDSLAKVKMDITDINYPEESFDVIYCSHVLEHVADDRRAMREFYRVLKANGWAILLVPVTAEMTIEDLSISDPAERLRLFGQEDHVRRYGPDYVERLREAGLRVKVTTASDFLSDKEILQMGITGVSGEIYYCTK